jgi:hypothetical protein
MARYWFLEEQRIERRDAFLGQFFIQFTPFGAAAFLEILNARSERSFYEMIRDEVLPSSNKPQTVIHTNNDLVRMMAALKGQHRHQSFPEESYWTAAAALTSSVPVYAVDLKPYRVLCPKLILAPS